MNERKKKEKKKKCVYTENESRADPLMRRVLSEQFFIWLDLNVVCVRYNMAIGVPAAMPG